MSSVGAVVVAFNSAEVIASCVERLTGSSNVELVVVDNASTDQTAGLAEAAGARMIRSSRNVGFASACSLGVHSFSRRHDWMAFVNPDVHIEAEDLLALALAAPPEVGAVTPLLIDQDGEPVADIRRAEPTVLGVVGRYLFTSRVAFGARRLTAELQRPSTRHVRAAVTSGGCLLVRAHAYERVGGFSDAYFLNMEDVELCCRLWADGFPVVVDTAIRRRHAKGTSTTVARASRLFECARAEMIFFERNRGRLQTCAIAAPVWLGATARVLAFQMSGDHRGKGRRPSSRRLARVIFDSVRRAWRRKPAESGAVSVFISASEGSPIGL